MDRNTREQIRLAAQDFAEYILRNPLVGTMMRTFLTRYSVVGTQENLDVMLVMTVQALHNAVSKKG
jgi:hypothetical protein